MLSQELETTIQSARNEMMTHADRVILPVNRLAIYLLLPSTDRSVFKKLSLITAESVLPVWQNALPADATAEHILNVAKLAFEKKMSSSAAEVELDKARDRMENLGGTEEGRAIGNAFYAGQAAVESLMEVLGHDPFENVILNERTTDADLDPWSSDTAHWAVTAYAGLIGDSKSNSSKRQEFWEWWLQDAIPQSLNL